MNPIKKLINSTLWSLDGLKAGIKEDQSLRMEAVVLVLALPLAWGLDFGLVEKFWLSLSLVLVFVIEILNTALEELVDHLFPEIHPRAKKIKDLGSAAVFLCVLHGLAVWSFLFWRQYGPW